MSAQPCLPQDIIEVNRTKEYTLISTDLLESVLTDTKLNAQTTKVWQLLFNKARYNTNFEIKISYSYLANKLGKSTRTIARYISSLEDSGYLIVKHNFDNNGGQRPSTISVRVPEFLIEHAKKKKDRLTKNPKDNNETLLSENNNDQHNYSIEDNSIDITSKEACTNPINVLHGTSYNNVNDLDHNHAQNNVLPISSELSTTIQEKTPPQNITQLEEINKATPLPIQTDKNDVGGNDRSVIQNNINKKDINKNNNTVVPLFQGEEQPSEIEKLESEISVLEVKLQEGTKLLNNIKDHALLYDQMRKNSQIQANLHLMRIKLERIIREVREKTAQEVNQSNLTNDPNFIFNREGERQLPLFTFKRLVKALTSYGYTGNMLNTYINEIIFEARFGSLVSCNKTKEHLTLDNAISIGLKLVREKRWSTPALLKKFVTQ